MNTPFEISGQTIQPGTTHFGKLHIVDRPYSDISLPLTVIHGVEPGPQLSITAGIHGAEYNGVYTCMRLGKEIDPKTLRGTVVMVPVVNIPSFETRTPFVNPLDGQNVNRVFPGKKNGTISEKIAFTVFEEVIRPADTFIDLHSGDLYEIIPLHTCCQKVGNPELDAKSERLARHFEIELLNIMGKGIDDLNATEDEQGTYFAGLQSGLTSGGNAALVGVTAVLLEAGGGGVLDQSVVKMELKGIKNVMRDLGMLEGKPDADVPHHACYGMYIMRSKFGGMFIPQVMIGDVLEKGQPIGEMQNLQGDVIATFTAPLDGVVLMMYTTPVRTSGETILIMARMDDIKALPKKRFH